MPSQRPESLHVIEESTPTPIDPDLAAQLRDLGIAVDGAVVALSRRSTRRTQGKPHVRRDH